jgi:hypothetical protein
LVQPAEERADGLVEQGVLVRRVEVTAGGERGVAVGVGLDQLVRRRLGSAPCQVDSVSAAPIVRLARPWVAAARSGPVRPPRASAACGHSGWFAGELDRYLYFGHDGVVTELNSPLWR